MASSMVERVARTLSEIAPHRYRTQSSGGIQAGAAVAWEQLREVDRQAFILAAQDLVTRMRALSPAEATNFAKALIGQPADLDSGNAQTTDRRRWLAVIDAAQASECDK